jgi:hypothetical protein
MSEDSKVFLYTVGMMCLTVAAIIALLVIVS